MSYLAPFFGDWSQSEKWSEITPSLHTYLKLTNIVLSPTNSKNFNLLTQILFFDTPMKSKENKSESKKKKNPAQLQWLFIFKFSWSFSHAKQLLCSIWISKLDARIHAYFSTSHMTREIWTHGYFGIFFSLFSKFSCWFLNPNYFFQFELLIVLLVSWETSWNKKRFCFNNWSDLSLFECYLIFLQISVFSRKFQKYAQSLK